MSHSWRQALSRTYKLDEVARSICSSSALLADEANQPAMVLRRMRRLGASSGVVAKLCTVGVGCRTAKRELVR